MTVEELQVIIAANTDQFKNELRMIQGELQKLNTSTGQLSKGVGSNLFGSMVKANVVGGLITGTFNRLSGLFSTLTGQVIDNGSNFTRLNVATKITAANLNLTEQQLKGLNEQLQDANTYGSVADNVIRSLALSGLVQMSEGLQAIDARSGEAKTGVSALVLTMKDLAAANAIDSSVGIERLTKFVQRGEATFADGMFELGNLNKEYQMFAKELGKSRNDLTAQEEAQARLNIVMREGQKVFGAYAATYETSGKAFGSIRDVIRNITEIIGSALEPVLRVAATGILQFFNAFRASMMNSQGDLVDLGLAFKNWAIKVAGYIVAVIRIIGTLLSRIPVIGKNFAGLANFTLKPIQAQGKLQKSVGGTGGAMDKTGKSAKALKKDLEDLAGFDEMEVLKQPDSGADSGGLDDMGGIGAIGGGGGIDLKSLNEDTAAIMEAAKKAEEQFKSWGETIDKFLKPLKETKIFGKPLIEVLGEIAKWVGIVSLAVGIGVKVFGIFAAVVGFVTSPIFLVVAAIGALIAIGVLLYNNVESIRVLFDTVGRIISNVLTLAWQGLGEAVKWFNETILQPAIAWWQANIAPVIDQIAQKLAEMALVFEQKLPEIQAAIAPLIEIVKNNLTNAFKILGTIIDWLWKNILKPLVDFILANIVPAFSMAIDIVIQLIKTFTDVYNFVSGFLTPIIEFLWNVIKTVFEAIAKVIDFAWNNVVKPVFKALYDFVTGFVIPVFQLLQKIGEAVFNKIREVVENAWAKIRAAIQPVLDWFNTNVKPKIEELRTKFEQVFNGIKNIAEGVWEGVKSAVKSGINGVIRLINGFIDKINQGLKSFSDLATSVGSSPITFRVGRIPELATGGTVTAATQAIIGEAGREVVLPLDQNTGWADILAEKIMGASGGSNGQPIHLVIQVAGKTLLDTVVEDYNDYALAGNNLNFAV